ncbi:MAG: hypothetical protein ACT4PX_09750 [Actinomycetota bacterium]
MFSVQMAVRDRPLLEDLRSFLGCGSISDRPPGRTGWQPTSTLFAVEGCDRPRKAHGLCRHHLYRRLGV